MKSFNKPSIMFVALSILLPLSVRASQTVRVVEDLGDAQASFTCQKQGATEKLALDIPVIALNDISLGGRQFKSLTLPASDMLFPGETSEEGLPDMPVLSSLLILPDAADPVLSVEYSGFELIEDVDIEPIQSPIPEGSSEIPPFTQNSDFYSQDRYYPENLAEYGEPAILRDIRFSQISIYPVQYNPARRELKVYHDLQVSVSYDYQHVTNPKTTRSSYLSDGFYPIYKSLFANFEELFSNTPVKRGGYLFICKPALVDSLKALVLWKHQKGYTTRIVPTTEIYSGGNPTYSQIFNYLRTAYQTWEIPPEYVNIVGDRDGSFAIPFYPYGSGYVSDNPYSCVDGADYLPDIFVGRMSVDQMQELRKLISKVFYYEKTPRMDDPQHWVRGLCVGYTLFQTARTIPLWARQLELQNGFAQVDTVFASSSTPLLTQYMNAGPGIVFYRGEAGTDGWWGPTYSISDLNAMPNNQQLGILAPIACGMGDFGQECFGEVWIRMGYGPDSLKGGPVFYGTSEHFGHTKWSNPLSIGFFWGIFGQGAYHASAAMVASKMQLYRTFPHANSNGGMVNQYFSTYNILGDPELEIRTAIPRMLAVTHPSQTPLGSNFVQIHVADTAGVSVEDAFVTLTKGYADSEEVFETGRTDADGNVSFSFHAESADTMVVTVSGRNLYPYQGYILLSQADVEVAVDSIIIDDDNLGNSIGNGDSIPNPNEIIELSLGLKNFGSSQAATNLSVTIESLDTSMVTVFDSRRGYSDISPGQVAFSTPFIIGIKSYSPDGSLAKLLATVTDGADNSWESSVELSIKAPKFTVGNIYFTEGFDSFDPGDSLTMTLWLINSGPCDAHNVAVDVTCADDYAQIVQGHCGLGNIPSADSAANLIEPFIIKCAVSTFNGRVVNLNAKVTTSDGTITDVPFHLTVGHVTARDPVGPESYGYYIYDNTDTAYVAHPDYQWVEIVPSLGGQGTRLNYGQNWDDNSMLVTLPFDFIYYGIHYPKIIVSINGFISPDTTRIDMSGHFYYNFYNWPIPDPGCARAQISAFWDDISYTGSIYGVYVWPDTANHRYVVEWYNMTHRNTGAIETFEMVISDPTYYSTLTGDAEITCLYKSILNNDADENYSSVGFENYNQSSGIQYEYDNIYSPGAAPLVNNRAIIITTNTGRGGVRGHVELSNGGHNENVMVISSTGQHRTTPESGDFWIKDIPPDSVDLFASAGGYFPDTIIGLPVIANSSISGTDFNLIQCPVPANLIASDTLSGRVEVSWDSVSSMLLAGYNLYRSRWEAGGFEKVNGTPLQVNHFNDLTALDSITYRYYITAVYSSGDWSTESFASNIDLGGINSPTRTAGEPSLPTEFFLSQNYPNPFNPTTIISYGLPNDCRVKVEVYNLLGQKIKTLVNGPEKAGIKSVVWDGRDTAGKAISSGVYFCHIDAGSYQASKKMLMLK